MTAGRSSGPARRSPAAAVDPMKRSCARPATAAVPRWPSRPASRPTVAHLLCAALLFQLGLPLVTATPTTAPPGLVLCTPAGLVVVGHRSAPASGNETSAPAWCPACIAADPVTEALPPAGPVHLLTAPAPLPRPARGPDPEPRAGRGAGNRDPPAATPPHDRLGPPRSVLLASLSPRRG